jgi:hypothetical protein
MPTSFGSSKTLDGTRLVIQTHLLRPSIDAKLWDAKRNRKFTKLVFTGALGVHGYQQQEPLNLECDLALSMGELLRCDDRSWERIEFEHCTGDLDVVLSIGLATERLQSLGFSEVMLDPPTFHSLSTGLKFNSSVTELRFHRCQMEDAIAYIGSGLLGNESIRSLTFDQCGLDDEKLSALLLSLKRCTSLQKLSIEGNSCRIRGMSEIAELLRLKTLQNLTLHNQRIEEGEVLGIAPLAYALSDGNSSLKFLDLSQNSICDEDVALLVNGLLDNTSLETLHLDRNLITDDGARIIAEGIRSMNVLKTLALPENPFGEEGASAILSAMVDNYNMETVIIPSGNSYFQRKIRWYGNLNRGGRKIFLTPRATALSLYPLALERVNNMPLTHDWNPLNAPAEVVYGLLRLGPILFERKTAEDSD